MKELLSTSDFKALLYVHGKDILESSGMQESRQYMQHGNISVYAHSVAVALLCLFLAKRLRVAVDEISLVRGALLHDYFLYDWHDREGGHRWHGLHHPKRALQNAERDFSLNEIERNMILSHMFPLCPCLPKYRESWILFTADKICAVRETFGAFAAG